MKMRLWIRMLIVSTTFLIGFAVPAAAQDEPYAPDIDPANFVETVTNPYFPLTPGTTYAFEGETADGTEYQETTILPETRDIQGIPATVVRDTVWLDGVLEEDTYDWYAQDKDGNVWYLGEDTREYEDGEVVSTEGSWEYGVDGAQPGIVMEAQPQVGDSYRQEYFEGEAEDMGEVTSLSETASVQQGDFSDVLVIRERTPLEPDIREDKYYAEGVGLIMEQMVEGGSDHSELVNIYQWNPAAEEDQEDTDSEATNDAEEEATAEAQTLPQTPIISEDDALSIAQEANPDANFTEVELEFERGTWVYSAESGDYETYVDGITGEVIDADEWE